MLIFVPPEMISLGFGTRGGHASENNNAGTALRFGL